MSLRKDVLTALRESLQSIGEPRFFETERGYQGALLGELHGRLHLDEPAIVEQEYQKQAGLHGLSIRPDIIIHEPFDPGHHRTRSDGNVAVMELKRRATPAQASADFQSLVLMLGRLQYHLGIFINIDSTRTHYALIPEDVRARIVCFAVAITGRTVSIIEHGS